MAESTAQPPSTDSYDRLFTVPNLLSVLRLLGVPLFLWLLLGPHADVAALVVLALSGISDWADGVLARRLNQASRLGELLDPLADRPPDVSARRRAAITRVGPAAACIGGDDPTGVHPSDSRPAVIRDVKVPLAIKRKILRATERSADCGVSVAVAAPARPATGEGADDAVMNPADPTVGLISDVQVTVRAHGEAKRVVQLCVGRRTAVTAEPLGAVASHGCHTAVRVDVTDDVLGFL